MYAYLMAKYLKKKKNVRVLAVGTGRDYDKMEQDLRTQTHFNKLDNVVSTKFLKFLTDFEQTTSTYIMKSLPQKDY